MRKYFYSIVSAAMLMAIAATPAQAGLESSPLGVKSSRSCATSTGLIVIVCPPSNTSNILIGPDGHI